MARFYTASAKQNPGRKAWLVEFRHPLRTDSSNKPGKKMRKGLGTVEKERADRLVGQLNALLANETLWSVGAKVLAEKQFDKEVVDIFYGEIEPRSTDSRATRDKIIPFPSPEEGYAKVALIGVPGAGKTTLLRQLIGTNPNTEKFPSTSVNRTTTFPTEIVVRSDDYRVVVTFLSEHETRFEVEECVSAAILEAVDGDREATIRALLEKTDMRFRLKYILGTLVDDHDERDPYDDDEDDKSGEDTESLQVSDHERQRNDEILGGYLARINSMSKAARTEIEEQLGPLDGMSPKNRSDALDLIADHVADSDEFLELVSDIMDEIRGRFEVASSAGKFEKSTTGWPVAWKRSAKTSERKDFLESLKVFSGISVVSWGKLLTPLVNGMRVEGPFQPGWSSEQPRLVLLDTEGLGHKASTNADLPDYAVALLHEATVIVLVDSAKNSMTNYASGKALESIVNAGHTHKLSVVFTHMDSVKGDNLRGKAKLDHVFLGLRNVIENQVAQNVSNDAARYLLDCVKDRTFYVGRIDRAEPKGAESELNKFLGHLMAEQPSVVPPVTMPVYSEARLVLAIQEAARDFRRQWQGILGISSDTDTKPRHWQTIKALARRYAENWGENFELNPAANLRAELESAVSRFLEKPSDWTGNPTAEEKRDSIERLKTAVSLELPRLSRHRLRERAQPAWYEAWIPRGSGSTFVRRSRIEGIYQRWVPVPDTRGDRTVDEFIEEVEKVVVEALRSFQAELEVTKRLDGANILRPEV